METDAVVVIGCSMVAVMIFVALPIKERITMILMRCPAVPAVEMSSSDSVVIMLNHSSLDSLRERLCIEGRPFVYEFPEPTAIRHK